MAVAPPLTMLSDARYREINTALGYILQMRQLAVKAKACGVDTSSEEAYIDAMEQNLNAWKQEFFPTKP